MPTARREQLAGTLRTLGVLRLLESVSRRPSLLVLNYHRIGNRLDNPFDDGVFSATTEDFQQHLDDIGRRFRFLSLDDLLHDADQGFAFHRPSAIITFDDGYRDNFELAYPILKRVGVPAIFFVPTAYIEEPRLPWWDHLAYIVKHTTRHHLTLPRNDLRCVEFDLTDVPRPAAIRRILAHFKHNAPTDAETFLRQLELSAEVNVDTSALGRQLFMSWEQLSQMVHAGMAVESHSHSHRILAHLSETEQHRELAFSKQILETRLSRPVTALSYPVGGRYCFSDSTKRLAANTGYRLAFSFYGGTNRPRATDAFDIRRLGVDGNESATLLRTRMILYSAFGRSF